MARIIDLNADIGELSGAEGRVLDAKILNAVTSCNIACGGHAGDAVSMRETLRLAKQKGVDAGAHPSYPDREGFGRRDMDISLDQLRNSLSSQIADLLNIAEQKGIILSHVKPHGALYNAAAKSKELAMIVAEVTAHAGIQRLVGLPDSAMELAARSQGIEFWGEGFADRSYEQDGSLTPRSVTGAVLECESDQIDQALALSNGLITSRIGEEIHASVQTICLHGDTPGAQRTAMAIRNALIAAGYEVGLS